jgi:hypothetical protein
MLRNIGFPNIPRQPFSNEDVRLTKNRAGGVKNVLLGRLYF